jgi:tRNA pseudouridine38-40 synthase
MRRLRAVVEYNGTRFAGFQRQPAERTVQGCLEEALAGVCGHPVEVVGAGRTDTGVHALGQVVHFDTIGRIPAERIAAAARSRSAPELVLRHVEETAPAFHARYDALRRTYHYYICREPPSPFLAPYFLFEERLRTGAVERMRRGAAFLVGRHDFGALTAAGPQGRSTIRVMESARVLEVGALLCLELTANAFLHHMVRMVAGLLLEIGRGRQEPEAVAQALETGERPHAVTTAPPHGLFLMRVEYPDGYPGPLVSTAVGAPWRKAGGGLGD